MALAGCGGEFVPADGQGAGYLEVRVSTNGLDVDSDGYTLVLDDGAVSQPVGVNGTIVFDGVAEGDHTVEISGLASNCSPYGGRQRAVAVPEGDSAFSEFEIACASTDGGGEPGRIIGIRIDSASLNRFDNNGDIFPITWADDGHLYTAGGDGDGWDGTDTRGMDITRLDEVGPTGDLSRGTELFSKPGVLPKGMIAVDGALYVLEQERGNDFARSRIGRSTDRGSTWSYNGDGATTWDFTTKAFAQGHFINFGQDNAQARDEFVYLLGMEDEGGGGDSPFDQILLARAPANAVQDVSQYEYFSGLGESPTWSSNIGNRAPVFYRKGHIHWGATINHNPILNRYLLSFFTDDAATLAVYEGPEPWGPWSKVQEETLVDTTEKHSLFFVNKPGWLSADGSTWWVVTSGVDAWDSFNVLRANLSVQR